MDTSVFESVRRGLQDDPAVVAAWVFGSVARGEARDGSDVDIALLLTSPRPHGLDPDAARLTGLLEKQIHLPVDLVVVNHAGADLVHRVMRDGELVIDADPRQRVAFEVRLRNEYFDLKPYLDEYRAAALR